MFNMANFTRPFPEPGFTNNCHDHERHDVLKKKERADVRPIEMSLNQLKKISCIETGRYVNIKTMYIGQVAIRVCNNKTNHCTDRSI